MSKLKAVVLKREHPTYGQVAVLALSATDRGGLARIAVPRTRDYRAQIFWVRAADVGEPRWV